MAERFIIDVVSDVICPWCFLGKRRLDAALAMARGPRRLHALAALHARPTIPPEGLDRQDYMLNKFGPERLKTIHDPLIEAGANSACPITSTASPAPPTRSTPTG